MDPAIQWKSVVPNRTDALMRAVADLDQWLQRHDAHPDARYLAQLTVEELGTNIIKYGYDDSAEHLIRILAAWEEDVLRICLEDDGHEFNPCTTPEPDPNLDLEDRMPGGWGLSLIRRLSAGMDYQRHDGRNIVSVRVPRTPSLSS